MLDTTSIDIQSTDSKLKPEDSQFLIGVYSPVTTSYAITVRTFPHVTEEQLKRGDHLGLKKLFIGESPDVKLASRQIKYFYFENWSNATVKF